MTERRRQLYGGSPMDEASRNPDVHSPIPPRAQPVVPGENEARKWENDHWKCTRQNNRSPR